MTPKSERWNPETIGNVLIKLAVAGLLLWALSRHAYSYYMLLRWVTFGAAIFVFIRAGEAGRAPWIFAFVVVALIFNPIMPLHFKRDTWSIIDVATAGVFLASIFLDVRSPIKR